MKLVQVVAPVPVRNNIQIELTPQDQDALYALCIRVSGPPEGDRGVTEALHKILYKNGAVDRPTVKYASFQFV